MSFTTESSWGEYQHWLNTSELPSHHHTFKTGIHQTGILDKYGYYPYRSADTPNTNTICETDNEGQNKPHNNVQPFVVIYLWKRIN